MRVIAETLELTGAETDNLKQEAGYKRLRKWNSSRHAEIIVAIEDEFGIEIDERSIPRLNNVAKIVEYVERTGE